MMMPKPRREESNVRPRPRLRAKPMTIAIAAMCGNDHATQKGSIIVCTDTLIAWGLYTSNTSGTKLYDLPHGFFATMADDVSRSGSFAGIYTLRWKSLRRQTRRLLSVCDLR